MRRYRVLFGVAFFFQAEDGIRDTSVTGVQTCALPISDPRWGVRVVRLALLTAAPFWLFLRLLHDGPTTVAIGGRITTMVASFVWLVAVLSPDRLVEAMVARGWSLAVDRKSTRLNSSHRCISY